VPIALKLNNIAMKRVKLKTLGVSYSQNQAGAYTLLLEEVEGKRRIPIVIGGFEAQAIVIKLENLEPPRPLTHDLFKNFADKFNIFISEVVISNFEDGVFFSRIICSDGNKELSIDSRTSDAVALALRFGCPIYIDDEILELAQILREPEKTAENLPNSPGKEKGSKYELYSDEELHRIIDEAIKKEDYETAAIIKEEIDRRKKRS